MPPTLAMVFGTYNRLGLLQRCIASLRQAAGGLSYVILACDGGSTDGTRAWLAAQPDVELLEGGLDGAVKAFNVGFARAVELEAPYVVQWNDDFEALPGGGPVLAAAVSILAADPLVGAVALESALHGSWDCERYQGLPMVTQSVIRRAAGMAAARAEGDPTGKAWWSPRHHTYASDSVLGCWIWRLGWEIRRGTGLRIQDHHCMDALRERNVSGYRSGVYNTGALFLKDWGHASRLAYSRPEAEKFGGLLR
jgi:glycosyltransferase involved in cell wall biosynthesis